MGRTHLRALEDARGIKAAAVVEPISTIREELDAAGLETYREVDELLPSPEFRARSGGILLDMGVHEFDQTRWLSGQEFLDVSAIAATVTSEAPVADDPESVAAVAQLSGGAVATVSLGRRLSVCEGAWVEMVGTEGHARTMFVWGEDGIRVIHQALIAQLEAFAAVVRGAEQQGATGEDALRAIEVADR